MLNAKHLLLTALAPILWGTTYIVTTEFLPNLDPISVAFLRAFPAGIILLLLAQKLPKGRDIGKMFILGALNFTVFWTLLFYAAIKLPGGIAAVVTTLQPLFVIFAARLISAHAIKPLSLFAVVFGIFGVSLMIISPDAKLDTPGICAGVLGSLSVSIGTVLSQKWRPNVSTLTFTGWQLCTGSILMLPLMYFFGESWAGFSMQNAIGVAYLTILGSAVAFSLWLHGLTKLSSPAVAILSFLSPITATLIGLVLLNQTLNWIQLTGMLVLFSSIFFGQFALSKKAS